VYAQLSCATRTHIGPAQPFFLRNPPLEGSHRMRQAVIRGLPQADIRNQRPLGILSLILYHSTRAGTLMCWVSSRARMREDVFHKGLHLGRLLASLDSNDKTRGT
jgi:hypothetical protein